MEQNELNARIEKLNSYMSSSHYKHLLSGTKLESELKYFIFWINEQIQDQMRLFNRLNAISIALSREKNTGDLLERIMTSARQLSSADAGTLYLLNADKKNLEFTILQNESMDLYLRSDKFNIENFLPVPLEVDGLPNHHNVSSYAAISGEIVNIRDVYKSGIFDFSGTRKYDAKSGYVSKSMLVIPMQNHEFEIIGVLQLINAIDPGTGKIRSFSSEDEEIVGALASQAAVVLTKTQLIKDLENLLNAFIQSIATAIDNKSPYTGRHVHRVVELAMLIAREINNAQDGPWAGVSFNNEEMEELRIAAWLHDVGKVATPEHILDKKSRLESVWDREEVIRSRFSLISMSLRYDSLKCQCDLRSRKDDKPLDTESGLDERLQELEDDLDFVLECNQANKFLTDQDLERLNDIAAKEFVINGKQVFCLTQGELECLSVRKGTLTLEERKVIENHAFTTQKILAELPFPGKLARVPDFAAMHHERPDGSGYPFGLSGEQMPLQARIMAVADVFEALTASDRPYKKLTPVPKALEILELMKKGQQLDPDVVDLFIRNKVYALYADRHLKPGKA